VTPGIPRAARRRAWGAAGVALVGLAGLAWNAWGLQVDDTARFRAQAARQHALTVEVAAPRGAIVDREGRPLAVTADADSVWANPREIVDVVATAEKLAAIVDVDASVIEARLASDRQFAWIARRVSPEVAAAVTAAGLPGVELTREPRRWYPAQSSAGPVIGTSDIDGNGVDGLELAMDDVLAGTRARMPALRDARGRTLYNEGVVPAVPGATVELAIDRTIQSIADRALGDAIAANKAEAGIAIVLDVATGDVLAMASWPTFDPNNPGPHGGARIRGVTDAYEIGSVMKLFTVAAAVDAGVVRADDWWDVEHGSWEFAGKQIRDTHHDWTLTTTGIIKRSSNVGAVKIALELGRERLHDGMRAFGFGTPTGIELPGEQRGVIRDGRRWRDIELATISYGYGMSVTPLQLVAAVAALGNDGVYIAPRIVSRITDAAGDALPLAARPAPRRVVKSTTAATVRAMMATVFDGAGTKQAGTASSVEIPGFRCGGKTGTARKLDPATRQYTHDHYMASFVGLAPIDRPRLAIVVVIDDPRGDEYYGGKVAGPAFATIAGESLRYLGVPGDAPPP
jgi:cell division protein FtsI (penicillin-binding protein 3)